MIKLVCACHEEIVDQRFWDDENGDQQVHYFCHHDGENELPSEQVNEMNTEE